MNLLVTGFGRFLDNDINPTEQVLTRLPKSMGHHEIHTILLPVAYDKCYEQLKQLIDAIQPEAILCLGLAAGSTSIRLERIAINCNDSLTPDNTGRVAKDELIEPTGPTAYFSRLPLREIEQALNNQTIPVSISNSAGLYVCNNLFYHVMHDIVQYGWDIIAGFVHVPASTPPIKHPDTFTLPIEITTTAIQTIIEILIEDKE